MRPNNMQGEINHFNAFLFFILTVAVIMVFVFGIRVPYAENEKLKNRSQMDKKISLEKIFQFLWQKHSRCSIPVNLDVTRAGLIDGHYHSKSTGYGCPDKQNRFELQNALLTSSKGVE